jgi:hypothetical protein
MLALLANQGAEIIRILVQRQPGQIVCETYLDKKTSQERAGGMAQVEVMSSIQVQKKSVNK